jgi:hypothetical protein
MLQLSSISSACAAHGGIASVYMLTPRSVVSLPRRKPDGTLTGPVVTSVGVSPVKLGHTPNTASYTCAQVDDMPGAYFRHTLSLKVSGTNAELQRLFAMVHESRLHIFFVDRTIGAIRLLPYASVRPDYDVPRSRGNRTEYTIRFEATSLERLGIWSEPPFVQDVEGDYWAMPDGSPWITDGGDAWIFD